MLFSYYDYDIEPSDQNEDIEMKEHIKENVSDSSEIIDISDEIQEKFGFKCKFCTIFRKSLQDMDNHIKNEHPEKCEKKNK